jgi:hypothetical protein
MIVLIDDTKPWTHVSTLVYKEVPRYYYLAAAPKRALLVCHGFTLPAARNRMVDANIGWDRADPGFSRTPGKDQTKITCRRIVSQPARWGRRLSEVLKDAPEEERA